MEVANNEIVTTLPESFLKEFEQEVMGTIPTEKVQAQLREAEIGRYLVREGSVAVQGLGQKLGEIDPRVWHRWNQEHPGCWQDKQFVHEFFADNLHLKADGWTPKLARGLRHGRTFVGGKPI